MNKHLFIIILLISLLIFACNSSNKYVDNVKSESAPQMKEEAPSSVSTGEEKDKSVLSDADGEGREPSQPKGKAVMGVNALSKPSDQAQAAEMAKRYIIKSADLSLMVISVNATLKKVEQIAKDAGGFLSDSNMDNPQGGTPSARIVIRVPEKQFDQTVEDLEKVGTVINHNIKSDDITSEYVDTDARLRNLKREEQQYLKILEKAYTIKDILQVTEQLSRVRGYIESTTSRLKKLGNLVSLSTITVSLSQKTQNSVTNIWDFSPTFSNAIAEALNNLAVSIREFIQVTIKFLVYLPVVLIITFVIWIIWLLASKFINKKPVISNKALNYIFLSLWVIVTGIIYPILFAIIIGIFLIALIFMFIKWVWNKFVNKKPKT